VAAGRSRIPHSIWSVLFLVTVLTMIAKGYHFGLMGARSWPATILLVLAFSSVMLLIADLDRPQSGFVRVSQQAMTDLVERMGAPTP
jgi:hypothetical protein